MPTVLLLLLYACAPEPCPDPPPAHESVASGSVWWVRDAALPWGARVEACALVQGDAEDVDVPGIPLDVDVDEAGLCSDAVAAASPGTVPVPGAGPARIPASIVASVDLANGSHATALLPDEAPSVGPWVLCCHQQAIYESEVVDAEVPLAPAGAAVEVNKTGSCGGNAGFAVSGAPEFFATGGCVSFRTNESGLAASPRHIRCGTRVSYVFFEDLPITDVEILNGDGTVQASAADVDSGLLP
jgi:hypothetical protein